MILYVGNKTTEAFVDNDLDKIANNINQIDPDAVITDWIILARSSSDAPFDKIRTQLRDELPGYVWTMEESSHGQTWIGKFTREDLGIVTTIKIMSAGSKTYLANRKPCSAAQSIFTECKLQVYPIGHRIPKLFAL